MQYPCRDTKVVLGYACGQLNLHVSNRCPQEPRQLLDVGGPDKRRQKVAVLRELCRAIIYTTMMSKQVTKSHMRCS
jgi:hypothetical protein